MRRLPLLLLAFLMHIEAASADCDAVRKIAAATGASVFAMSTGDVRLRAPLGDILVYCDRVGFTVYGVAKPAPKNFYTLVGRAGAALLVGSADTLAQSAERCMATGIEGSMCPMIGSFFIDCWDDNICRVERAD